MIALRLAGAGWVAAVHGLAARATDGVEVVRVAPHPGGGVRRAAQAGGAAPAGRPARRR